ncbi:hypothetical protein BTA51_27295 [Hahella sp. CCB-MM4]|uniref:MNIO family bufferin maturase n=1 Tax=Hahella sp. (strain CCB-MM4) TaxID=1926491 RepID=UPI000B9B1D18|nr:DUF692 domain-containing protein [Hahella sp. CCB-MM4]OZG70183.1 hypothetical protein BTA51_27295 [Hahella sp. CCB-MM4]
MSTSLSLQAGIGIRAPYFASLLENQSPLGFVEAHSENYFGNSLSRDALRRVREKYPVSLHGVGLSLGRADGLDREHLRELKDLIADIKPCMVSEHLAWSGYQHRHVPDLLPVPYVEASLQIFIDHAKEMQDILGQQILVENPSNYLAFKATSMEESSFLDRLAGESGCGLLLDVNNLYISSVNVGVDPYRYISQINPAHISQYHLAGHISSSNQEDSFLIDSHNRQVSDLVWDLFEYCIQHIGPRPTLIEWDSDYPELAVLLSEADRATGILNKVETTNEPT